MNLHLPTVNAALNFTCSCLLLAAYIAIRRQNIERHRRLMWAAFGVSVLFLMSYLYYHANYGSTRFTGTGWIRPVYFTILISHTILAAAIVPMILVTGWRAVKGRYESHARLARWTWPLWMYVSVTGVVIYAFLYL